MAAVDGWLPQSRSQLLAQALLPALCDPELAWDARTLRTAMVHFRIPAGQQHWLTKAFPAQRDERFWERNPAAALLIERQEWRVDPSMPEIIGRTDPHGSQRTLRMRYNGFSAALKRDQQLLAGEKTHLAQASTRRWD